MLTANTPCHEPSRGRLGPILLIPLAWFGCGVRMPVGTDMRPTVPEPGPPTVETPATTTTLGQSVEGRAIECLSFGTGDDTILFIATIHGSESAGTPLLGELAEHLRVHPELLRGRQVALIPVANPDGYDRRTRLNARRVDLNRNFPAGNRKNRTRYGRSAFSEPESRAIGEAIRRYRPDRIVSIHQPAACIDYDGPGKALAAAMAAAGRLKVKRLGSKPGSLGSYGSVRLGIPVITVELPRKASRLGTAELWHRYGHMLLTAIRWGRAGYRFHSELGAFPSSTELPPVRRPASVQKVCPAHPSPYGPL